MKQSTKLLLLLFIIHVPYIQGMNSLTQQASTIESKTEVAIRENLTLESLLNLLSTDIIETQTMLFATNATLVASTATIESLIELFTSHVELTENDVSYLDIQFATIETTLDITSTQIYYAFSSINVLESMLTSYTQVTTLITTTGQIAALSALDSIASQVASDAQTLSNQWSSINSFLDQGNTTIDSMIRSISSVDTTLSLIDAQISADIVTFNNTINSTAESSNSLLDVITPLAESIQSIIAEIQMDISNISNSLNSTTSGITTAQTLANQASYDFQQTWTMLNSLQNISLQTAESFLNALATTANQINFLTDQSGTLTVIASINSLVLLMQNQINSLTDGMNRINNLAYANTFTALNQVLLEMSSLDSLIDSFATNTAIEIIQAYLGTPIHQSDVGTTGYTISASGNYYLAENIIFNPPFTSTAITFNSYDISLDLSGKFIMQTNNVANVFAFNTAGGQINDLVILNGSINGFTGNGILGSYLNLQLNNLIFENCSGIAISLTSGSANCILRNVSVIAQKGTSPLTIATSQGIVLDSCNFLEASSSSGIVFNNLSTEIIVRNCKVVDMNSTGIALTGIGGNVPKRVIFDGCSINSNNGTGISLGTSTNCVIKNCVIKNNTNGVTSSGSFGTIINNVIANNGTGISITGNNNAIMFNTFMSNTSTNINSTAGRQSYLGNFAFNPTNESNNYSGFLLPKIILNASQAFPAVTPTYWENVSMTQ